MKIYCVLPVAVQKVGGQGPGWRPEGRLMFDRGRFLGLTAGDAANRWMRHFVGRRDGLVNVVG